MFAAIATNYSLKDSTKLKNKWNLVIINVLLMTILAGIGYFTYYYLKPLEVNSDSTSVERNSGPIDLKSNQDISQISTNKIPSEKAKYVECWPVKESSEKQQTQVANTGGNNNGKIIGDKDSKIYHVPGSRYYQRELQKMNNNEYFNTVAEAEAVGYRAPKN